MNDKIGNFGDHRSANNGSREWCRRLANADALKRHERVNAFNLVVVDLMVIGVDDVAK